MATYIEDEETSRLIEEYAKELKTTKTGALRSLLRRELKDLKQSSPEKRFQAALAYVTSAPAKEPVTQADIDCLYEYL